MAFFRSPIVYIALVCLEKVANHITFDQSTKQTHHTFFPKRETSISFVFCSLSSLGIDLPLIWVSEHYVVGSWSLWCIWNPWRSCCWTTLSCGCFACRLRRQYPPVWVLKFELPASSWQRSPIPEDPSSLACPSPLVCVTYKRLYRGPVYLELQCTVPFDLAFFVNLWTHLERYISHSLQFAVDLHFHSSIASYPRDLDP